MMLPGSALLLLLAVAAIAADPAPPASPMAVFEPYAGTWSCLEAARDGPAHTSVVRFDFEARLLRETAFAPKSSTHPAGDLVSAAFGFDPRTGRYVEVEMDGDGRWRAATAGAPKEGVFHWLDAATSETASRREMTLPAEGAFSIESFKHPQDKTPAYRASCERRPD